MDILNKFLITNLQIKMFLSNKIPFNIFFVHQRNKHYSSTFNGKKMGNIIFNLRQFSWKEFKNLFMFCTILFQFNSCFKESTSHFIKCFHLVV